MTEVVFYKGTPQTSSFVLLAFTITIDNSLGACTYTKRLAQRIVYQDKTMALPQALIRLSTEIDFALKDGWSLVLTTE